MTNQTLPCREAFEKWFAGTNPSTLDFSHPNTLREFAYQVWKDSQNWRNTRAQSSAPEDGEAVAWLAPTVGDKLTVVSADAAAKMRTAFAVYTRSNAQGGDPCRERCQRLHPHTQLRLTRSIAPDTNWHWSVVMPDGHTYDVSKGQLTFENAILDLNSRGVTALDAADTVWRRNAAISTSRSNDKGTEGG